MLGQQRSIFWRENLSAVKIVFQAHWEVLLNVLPPDDWSQSPHLFLGSLSASWSLERPRPLQKPQPTNEWRGRSCNQRQGQRSTEVSLRWLLQSEPAYLPGKLRVTEGHDLWPVASRKRDDRRILFLWRDTGTYNVSLYICDGGRLLENLQGQHEVFYRV